MKRLEILGSPAALFLVGVAALTLLPWFAEKFYVQFFAKILIMAIFAMSLDLLLGYAGLVSFGHAAFYGAAGYVLPSRSTAKSSSDR